MAPPKCRHCSRQDYHGHVLTMPDGTKVSVWFQPRRWQ